MYVLKHHARSSTRTPCFYIYICVCACIHTCIHSSSHPAQEVFKTDKSKSRKWLSKKMESIKKSIQLKAMFERKKSKLVRPPFLLYVTCTEHFLFFLFHFT